MLEGVSAVKDHFILLMKTTVVAWFSQSTQAIPCPMLFHSLLLDLPRNEYDDDVIRDLFQQNDLCNNKIS